MTDVVNHATGGKKRSSAPSAQMSKGPWTEEEDRKVVELVGKYGPKKWSQIASELPGSGECCLLLFFVEFEGRWSNVVSMLCYYFSYYYVIDDSLRSLLLSSPRHRPHWKAMS